ncbi:asparagine--tRNA ligase, mitochondrial [[Candida] jaroonii]|uniref:Asparagine--tRNA ligase, mitochondrial n=1 Tax=[Candida] jaroonii TaxID=467808 RepID=A0ACA9YCQ0_9ASCO|nr:asparagine--tRNA ligase, mitochondrial [[Candida] jaroonii]
MGHIRTVRKFKKIGFLDITDGSSYKNLSVVCKDVNLLNDFKVGQSVYLEGTVVESKGTQDYELSFDVNKHKIKIVGDIEDSYPIQKKETSFQFLRTIPEFRHRTSTLASILRLRSDIEFSLLNFFKKQDFVKVTPPMVTSADTEGAGEQFALEPINPRSNIVNGKEEIDHFFGKPAYLTVSTQLHLEILAASLNRVWTLTPCFRAEYSNTNRHLSEFWMLEAEISFVEEISQLTDFCEDMIKSVILDIKANSEDVLGSRFNDAERQIMQERWDITDKKWPSITYTEAITILKNHDSSVQWGDSISTEHEKWLAGEHFQSPVFITDYPKSQKPFYMPLSKNNDTSQPTVACFDLIFPTIGELIGGSLREHNYDKLVEELQSRGMKRDMNWYLAIRKNGSVPHGGFGMGFERLLLYLTSIENIRDVVTFPRSPQSCDC